MTAAIQCKSCGEYTNPAYAPIVAANPALTCWSCGLPMDASYPRTAEGRPDAWVRLGALHRAVYAERWRCAELVELGASKDDIHKQPKGWLEDVPQEEPC